MPTSIVVLCDGNSIGYAAQSKAVMRQGDYETHAIFNFLNKLRIIRQTFPLPAHELYVLWDGYPKWRHDMYDGYKANRVLNIKTASASSIAADAARTSYKLQLNDIYKLTNSLGITQLVHSEWEADDLARVYVDEVAKRQKNQQIILVTGDKDWLQLVSERVSWYEHRSGKMIMLENFCQETGYKTPRAYLQAKALRGDRSDGIPGVGGIGEKTAKELLWHFPSVEVLNRTILSNSDDVKSKISRSAFSRLAHNGIPNLSTFLRNMQLMDLRRTPSIPIHSIKTVNGAFNKCSVRYRCEDLGFSGIASNIDNFVKPFEGISK